MTPSSALCRTLAGNESRSFPRRRDPKQTAISLVPSSITPSPFSMAIPTPRTRPMSRSITIRISSLGLIAKPFKNDSDSPFQGLGFGIAGSRGLHNPSASLTSGYKSDGQQGVFSYNSGVTPDGGGLARGSPGELLLGPPRCAGRIRALGGDGPFGKNQTAIAEQRLAGRGRLPPHRGEGILRRDQAHLPVQSVIKRLGCLGIVGAYREPQDRLRKALPLFFLPIRRRVSAA